MDISSEQAPAISVLVPIYNTEKYLRQALDSLRAQTFTDFEVILINDGSTDGSRAIMQEYLDADARFRVIDKPNSGYGASMNRGLDEARGAYVAILEPDDFIQGEMYADLFAVARAAEVAPDIVKTPYVSVDPVTMKQSHCRYWQRIAHASTAQHVRPFVVDEEPLLFRYHPSIWSAIYRRDFLLANNIRFHEIPGAGWADNPFMADTLLRAESIVYVDREYYCYRAESTESSTANIADVNMTIGRWNDITDTMEQLHVTDAALWDIQVFRAFAYLNIARTARNFEESAWREAASKTLRRLPAELVASSKYISDSQMTEYEGLTGLSLSKLPKRSSANYYKELASEAYWKLRQNGFKAMASRVKQKATGDKRFG